MKKQFLMFIWILAFSNANADNNKTIESTEEMLHQAILNDSGRDVRKYIQTKTNKKDLESFLLRAALLNKVKAVEELLKHGVDPNINYLGQSLFHYAMENHQLELAIYLLRNGANFSCHFNNSKEDVVTYMSHQRYTCYPGKTKQSHLTLINELINKGYDFKKNVDNNDPLQNPWYWALKKNDTNLIHFFLNQYPPYQLQDTANPNHIFNFSDKSSFTPLLIAIHNYEGQYSTNTPGGPTNIIGMLLQANADINQQAEPNGDIHTPLSYALTKKYDSYLIELLIEQGASMEKAFELFIEDGGDPNYQIKYSYRSPVSLLLRAIYSSDKNAVKILLDHGVNINHTSNSWPKNPKVHLRGSHTPLEAAITIGNKDIINLLLHYGAKFHKFD